MAGTCLHRLCLPWVDVAAQLQGVGRGAIYGCPGAFGLILREVHVHVLCGGRKESGTSVPDNFPIFPLPPSLSKLLCLAHSVSPLSLQALVTPLEQQAVRSLVTQGGHGDVIPGLVPQHQGDPPELCPMGASSGPMGVLQWEWGLRAALLGTLLLGQVTSQKGCSCTRRVLLASLRGSWALAQGASPTILKVMTKDINGYGPQD